VKMIHRLTTLSWVHKHCEDDTQIDNVELSHKI
jgi:hypothetical protein